MGGLGVKIQHFPLTLLVVLTTLTLPCERDRVVIFGFMVWFSGSANSTMSVTFGSDIPMATKIYDFQHKIGYNSACAGV